MPIIDPQPRQYLRPPVGPMIWSSDILAGQRHLLQNNDIYYNEGSSNHHIWSTNSNSWIEQPGPYNHTPIVMDDTSDSRFATMSLLSLISWIKKQNKETYWNRANTALFYLQIKLQNIITSRNNKHLLPILVGNQPRDKCLESVSKRLGYPLIYSKTKLYGTFNFLPKFLCKSYWRNNELSWLTIDKWENDKKDGYIKWCSFNKEWAWTDCFITVHLINPISGDPAINTQEIAQIKDTINYKNCSCGEHWLLNTKFIFQPELDLECCPSCISKSMPNPIWTQETLIGNYHSHKKNWKFYIQRSKDKKDIQELPMGLEIEVHPKYDPSVEHYKMAAQRTAWIAYQAQKWANPAWNNFYCEWDGSLNEGGYEYITNPMTLKVHQEYWHYMLPTIRKQCHGWKAEQFGSCKQYGIHITTHKKYWTDRNIARLGSFWARPSNQQFLFAIAQRASIYKGDILGSKNLSLSKIFNIKNKKLYSWDRYGCINIKDPLIEFRMFRTTLNQESFMKNIEFIDAFLRWCNQTPYNTSYSAFIGWLTNPNPDQDRYPNLLSYLSREKFACKETGTFSNPFKEFMKADFKKGQKLLFDHIPELIIVNDKSELEDTGDYINPKDYQVITDENFSIASNYVPNHSNRTEQPDF